jgi:hypothetical protein
MGKAPHRRAVFLDDRFLATFAAKYKREIAVRAARSPRALDAKPPPTGIAIALNKRNAQQSNRRETTLRVQEFSDE